MKSVNPAVPINYNLLTEVVESARQLIVSKPAISTFDQFRTLPKPAYQIIYKNKASMLQLT